MKVDKFYYPVDFVVLDTEPVAEGTNQVPIILMRPFLATSNAVINCRNGVMQLTFGNMTLELNIFHLSNKHKSVGDEEQNSDEVCLSGTNVGKYSAQELQEELTKNKEGVNEESPASVIPPAPLESRMLKIKKQKLNSTAGTPYCKHEGASPPGPPMKSLGCTTGSGSYRNLETTPNFDGIFALHYFKF